MQTQKELIITYLAAGNPLTSMKAFELFGITRLSGRIFELRKDGYAIDSETKSAKNRYGKIVSFTQYSLEESEAND